MSNQARGIRTFPINFRGEFAVPVGSGAKRQTVRRTRADNKVPRPGDRIKAYTGLRTSKALLIYDSTVTECFPVQINFGDERPLVINGVCLHKGEADAFARLDGFPHSTAMLDWFQKAHLMTDGDSFEGFCVCWRLMQ
jgi:hypothetical protein